MNDKFILFLTTAQVEHGRWSNGMRTKLVSGLINTLLPVLKNSVYLTIKIHPTENIDDYRAISEVMMATLCRDISLEDALDKSDLVLVSGYSTAILEAAISRTPVLLLNIFNEIEAVPFVDMGIAKGVYSLDDLLESVEELLYDQSAREIALNNH